MTGANYTGGKRNFARARFRDSTRRAQKSHFGRRRLEILSRGLGNGPQSKEEESSGITGILLEHAQREFSRPPEYMRSNRTEAPDTFSGLSSPFVPERGIKPSEVVLHTLDNESYPSLRAEANRVLEFSRTVGLCNYPSSSRKQSGSPLLASDVESESKLGSPQQQNYYNSSPISEFSERHHPGALLESVASGSGNLETVGARSPLFGPFRKPAFSPVRRGRERDSGYTKPTSDYEHQPREFSRRKAQLVDTLETQLSQDRFSPGFSDRNFCAQDSFPPSFDALEFPTSPLPPSSPLPSSTIHGSLLSRCQAPRVNEGTSLGFDATPARGYCEAVSSTRSGYIRFRTPDFPSLRSWSHSHRVHEVPTPLFILSSSKADLIPELLTRDNPWNAIGDMLDLPPIPTANETYFKEIMSHRSFSHERISQLASSSSTGRADRVGPSSLAQIEDTRLRATQSDGAMPATNSAPHGVGTHLASSSLLCGDFDSTTNTAINLESQSQRDRYFGSLASGQRGSYPPSLAIESLPIPGELLQSRQHSHTPPASPRGSDRTLALEWNNFLACVAEETPSGFATPQRSLKPIPKPPHSLTASALSSPGPMHWNTISEIDLDTLIPKTPSAQTIMARTQRPKLVDSDLFGDKMDDLRRMS